MKSLNKFDPRIKFTYDPNKQSIAFIDKKVSLRNGKFFTDLCVKPTDHHQYLHHFSAHPYHTKTSVFFSQSLRITWLCSSEKDFEDHKEEMKSWIRNREYPDSLIRSEMNKIKFSKLRPEGNDKNHKMKGIRLVVTYHSLLKSLSGIIDKNLSILYMDKEKKKVFTLQPMVSFR